MTNEELAVQIQLGASDLYAELWEQVKKLMTKILFKELSTYTLPNYINQEDMVQELYFALCKAVQAYDDTKPYKFTSYLTYSIKSVIQSKFRKKTFSETSYNITVDESKETELLDFIAGSTSTKDFENLELTDLQQKVRQAIADLPENNGELVSLYYLRGVTYDNIAAAKGESKSKVQADIHKGVSLLRKNRSLQSLYGELTLHYNKRDWLLETALQHWQYSNERYNLKQDIERRRNNGEYISYGTEQTILTTEQSRFVTEYIRKH